MPVHSAPAAALTVGGHAVRTVTVCAPGRLHLGFLDPAGTLGRRFGSLGLMIEGYETEVQLSPAEVDRFTADGPEAEAELARAARHLQRLREQTGRREPLALHLRRVLPPHAGFGSGTQLALAVGRAFARCHGLDEPTPRLAHWLGRGLRSGIGIAGFDQGGLIVDGGPSPDGSPAPVLARLALPEAWRVIVVQDGGGQGLSGEAEVQSIAHLEPMAQAEAAEICHQVLMRVLPGVASGDFAPFAAGLNRIQAVLGRHFAPAQGGSAWTSPAVGRLLEGLRGLNGNAAIGQSSWGPTGFAIVPDERVARRLLDDVAELGSPRLQVRVVAPRNRGATVTEHVPA